LGAKANEEALIESFGKPRPEKQLADEENISRNLELSARLKHES
jgi:hypothetical protein